MVRPFESITINMLPGRDSPFGTWASAECHRHSTSPVRIHHHKHVAGQGFEPRLLGPEPSVLPLDDPAVLLSDLQLSSSSRSERYLFLNDLIELNVFSRDNRQSKTTKRNQFTRAHHNTIPLFKFEQISKSDILKNRQFTTKRNFQHSRNHTPSENL